MGGNRWEYNVIETNRDLWRINGFEVTPLGSDAMKTWEVAGMGIPWVNNGATAIGGESGDD